MTGDGPLLGDLRVLELGEALAASVCGRLFAELGAEVLRVRLRCTVWCRAAKPEQEPSPVAWQQGRNPRPRARSET